MFKGKTKCLLLLFIIIIIIIIIIIHSTNINDMHSKFLNVNGFKRLWFERTEI